MHTLLDQENDRLRNVLLYALLDDKIRRLIGLEGVSQFFHSGQGWYFWLSPRAGVYEIEFRDRKEENGCTALEFALKYYPHPEEAVFERFSIAEQLFRLRYPFEKKCPTPQCREDLKDFLFYIGKFKLIWSAAAVQLSICSQHRFVEYHQQGITIKDDTGTPLEIIRAGEKDRNVPGWALSFVFYNCLMKAFCFIYRSAPQQIILQGSLVENSFEEKKKEAGEAAGVADVVQLTAAISLKTGMPFQGDILAAATGARGAGKIVYQGERVDILHSYPQLFAENWWKMAEKGREILREDLRV